MEGVNNKGLHQIFKERALEFPNKVAVSFGNESLTYSELDQASDYYASKLLEKGVKKNDLVGLCFNRNNEMIVGVLSILKAGAAYVPIDPTYPLERRNYIVEDSGLNYLMTEDAVKFLFDGQKIAFIEVNYSSDQDKFEHAVLDESVGFDTAYVIYTSGTTGNPKGVLVDHHNVVRLFEQTHRSFDFKSTDVWSLFHSICFDFSVWEIWGALLYGGELIVVPYSITRSPIRFYQLVKEKGITFLSQTPSAFRNFVAIDEENKATDFALRYIVFGGENLEYNVLKPWVAAHGDVSPQLVNMYGITETTVHVTHKLILKEEVEESQLNESCSIGIPIADLTIHLLNQDGVVVSPNEIGEMYISGAGVARGYLNKPELTAERFVEKEINGVKTRMYRSGDLAYKDELGGYHFEGRADDQIKLNGFRIEPRELESISIELAIIKHSIVLKVGFEAGDDRLVNFVHTNEILTLDRKEKLSLQLNEIYRKRVPSHMVPFASYVIDAFPITSNGKIDKKALIQMALDKYVKKADSSTDSNKQIIEKGQEIWESILQKKDFDLSMDLFDLGGTSLSLIQLIQLTKQTFQIDLNMRNFVDGFTFETYVKEVYSVLAKQIWLTLLNKSEVEEDSDFFDLGGTSLLLIQLMNQTEQKLSIKLEMSRFSNGLTLKSYQSEIHRSVIHVETKVS